MKKKRVSSQKKKVSLSPKRKKKAVVPQRQEQTPEVSEGVHRIRMKTIGIGGGGSAIVGEIAKLVSRVDFVVANTDLQALKGASSKVKTFAFGKELTRGLGCGMDAELGERAAKEEKERIKHLFAEQDLCLLVASLGGGSGSGAAPVFAQAAQEAKCLTIGVFTMPFAFEGEKRIAAASQALDRLRPLVNAYLVIPNEHIFHLIERNTPLKEAFSAINRRLAESLEGLVETVYLPGVINIDFADLRSMLEGKGKLAYLYSAKSSGPLKAQEVAKHVLANPLVEYGLEGVERILFTVSSDKNMKMQEVSEVSQAISSANPKARIIFGLSHDPGLKEKMRVMLFGVGCKGKDAKGERPIQKEQVQHLSQKKQKIAGVFKKPVKKQKTAKEPSSDEARVPVALSRQDRAFEPARRNGLDVKEAMDREMKILEEKELEWDTPAFLRKHLKSDS
ncbi:MAG: cell division protein FtsZ [Candidatus Yanofskybacteria bacterium]|nr:cell division protein FtsZ [Candidatus Yanofskybacteria bacterium]